MLLLLSYFHDSYSSFIVFRWTSWFPLHCTALLYLLFNFNCIWFVCILRWRFLILCIITVIRARALFNNFALTFSASLLTEFIIVSLFRLLTLTQKLFLILNTRRTWSFVYSLSTSSRLCYSWLLCLAWLNWLLMWVITILIQLLLITI